MPFKSIKKFLFNFFHFNKQERNGIFILCVIIAVLFGIRILMPLINRDSNTVQLITINATQASSVYVKAEAGNESLDKHGLNSEDLDVNIPNERFVFNPNTVSNEDAQKLGFSKKLSATLVNFRSKGGKFFKPEDLKKLYGLSPKFYEELEPYILIANTKSEHKRDTVYPTTVRSYEKKNFAKTLIEINSADSLSIVYLKGIGPGFTKRIMKYRAMLGGFHSINQLKEVYGMNDSLFMSLTSQIKLDANTITKISINAIDFNSLRKHPYFNFQTAQAIVNYRLKHGKLTEENLKDLGVFSDKKLSLVLPYLSY